MTSTFPVSATTISDLLRAVRHLAKLDRTGRAPDLETALDQPCGSAFGAVLDHPWLAKPLVDMFRLILFGFSDPAHAERLFAARLAALAAEGAQAGHLAVLRALGNGILAHVAGYAPDVCAESVRFSLPDGLRPSHAEMTSLWSAREQEVADPPVVALPVVELADLCRPGDAPDAIAAAEAFTRVVLALDLDATRLLLRSVEKETLAIALLGVRSTIALRLIEAMGPRAQALFLRDMRDLREDELTGPPGEGKILRCQADILRVAEQVGVISA